MNEEIKTEASLMIRAWLWMKGFPKRHKIITTLVLLYAACKLVMTPIVNPFASDVYTIRGRFPFDEGFSLSFHQSAYGDAQWLRRWCGWPMASQGVCTGGSNWMEPTRIGKDHYELKLYRDRYIFGLGEWKEATSFLPYLSSAAAGRNMMLWTAYANNESSVCDDSEEMIVVVK